MESRAFLVLGPESSGTRLMTRLLMAAGCEGDDGHDQRWDEQFPDPAERPLIVWRRSVPHRGEWHDADWMIPELLDDGYAVSIVIMSRDWHAMAISQQQIHTNGDIALALSNIRLAYRCIFNDLVIGHMHDVPYELVNYEAIVMRPAGTLTYLFGRLGLTVPAMVPDIYDGNARYYRDLEGVYVAGS